MQKNIKMTIYVIYCYFYVRKCHKLLFEFPQSEKILHYKGT